MFCCFILTEYEQSQSISPNRWIHYLTSTENRHALPMFTSLLNTVCAYDPVGFGIPYNHLLFADSIEPLVEVCLQILIVTLDYDTSGSEEVNFCNFLLFLNVSESNFVPLVQAV